MDRIKIYLPMHFLNQKPLVGAITFYNPSAAEGAQDAINLLSSSTKKTSDGEDGRVMIDPNAPSETSAEMETGSDYGDDDEDEDW